MLTKRILSVLLFSFIGIISHAQRGKNGSPTITTASTQLNAYTSVTANVAVNSTSVSVANSSLTLSVPAVPSLATPLAAGDLVMIIQMQGAYLDIDSTLFVQFGIDWSTPHGYTYDWMNNGNEKFWGQVMPNGYGNCGKYELREVASVTPTSITFTCGTSNAYTAAGKVQIVRVPRFTNLTVNANMTVVPALWDGTIGGIVALEIDGNLSLGNNSKITATGYGFRGGVVETQTLGSPPGDINANAELGANSAQKGAEKGEGIGGWVTEYNLDFSRYGRGAPGNAGGGGSNHNSGGGGGSNVGSGTYNGGGNPDPAYTAIWNLEQVPFGSNVSSGGGRGGYSYSTSNQNEAVLGPKNSAWGGDYRRVIGGLGGHALTYDASRIFFGGGGGAGDANTVVSGVIQGGNGGRGGGIVFLTINGTTSGSGRIESDGGAGQNSNPLGSVAASSSSQKFGNDGAGGAGGGGSIIISNGTTLPATIILSSNGGSGGNQVISVGNFTTTEADGPGGGGGGGLIKVTNTSGTQSVSGGNGGTTNSTHVSAFPPNGATAGGAGLSGISQPFFNMTTSNVSICTGNTATLTATIIGTLPAGATITWYTSQFGSGVAGTGVSFTTPILTSTTTYYLGTCPSTFRIPVTVTVGGPSIGGTATVTNASCSSAGSITGLTTTGGIAPITITWNGVVTPGMNLTNASAGTYTVLVTDNAGCTATSGPYTITSTGGPTLNTTNVVITNASCSLTNGSITGITASGSGLTYLWSNGASSLDVSNIGAGNYSLVVTDINGCTANAGPFTITQNAGPVIDVTNLSISNTTCGLNNGAISGITVSGSGLSYLWSNNATTLTISNLSAGNYSLTVTDANGCTSNAGPFSVGSIAPVTVDVSNVVVTNATCAGNNGSISGITANGSGLSYLWTNGATTANISNLSSGTYSLTVTDINGCTAGAGPFTITQTSGPVVNATNAVVTNANCLGNNGSITGISVTGSGLSYLWSNGLNTLDIFGLGAGSYGLLITDVNGCNATAGPFNIVQTTGPTMDLTNMIITNETCSNSNGGINGISTSGNGLTFTWNGNASPTSDITGISSGTYTLIATDNIGCTVSSGPINITNSPSPTIDLTGLIVVDEHCGSADGSINGIQIIGGANPVSVSWNGGLFTTLNISNLSAGNYTLVVTDGNGCMATAGPFTVLNVAGPTIDLTNMLITAESCAGNDGSITGITSTGSNLIVTWNSVVSGSIDLLNQTAGNYTLVVTDAFGCSATSGPFTILGSTPMSLDSSNLVVQPSGCTVNVGSITGLLVVGGINPTVSWSNGASTANISNLAAGIYTITVTDNQNCTITSSFVVGTANPPIIDISAVVISDVHCNQNDGQIVGVSVSGGTMPYQFQWDGNSALNTLILSATTAGNHTLVVTDSLGCTATEVISIGTASGPVLSLTNLIVTDATCGQNNGSITGIQASGDGPFTFTWSGSPLTSIDLVNLPGGTYTLTTLDANGCTVVSSPIVVVSSPAPNADFTFTNGTIIPNDVVNFADASTGSNITSWTYTLNGVGNISTTEDFSYVFTTEGTYTVNLIIGTTEGCVDSISKVIQVFGELIIPNVVTRNSDGTNDAFFIQNLKPNTQLIIQNRWGNVVFDIENYLNDWSGLDMNGERLAEGVYFYQLITPEGQITQGFVHLLIP